MYKIGIAEVNEIIFMLYYALFFMYLETLLSLVAFKESTLLRLGTATYH